MLFVAELPGPLCLPDRVPALCTVRSEGLSYLYPVTRNSGVCIGTPTLGMRSYP